MPRTSRAARARTAGDRRRAGCARCRARVRADDLERARPLRNHDARRGRREPLIRRAAVEIIDAQQHVGLRLRSSPSILSSRPPSPPGTTSCRAGTGRPRSRRTCARSPVQRATLRHLRLEHGGEAAGDRHLPLHVVDVWRGLGEPEERGAQAGARAPARASVPATRRRRRVSGAHRESFADLAAGLSIDDVVARAHPLGTQLRCARASRRRANSAATGPRSRRYGGSRALGARDQAARRASRSRTGTGPVQSPGGSVNNGVRDRIAEQHVDLLARRVLVRLAQRRAVADLARRSRPRAAPRCPRPLPPPRAESPRSPGLKNT